MLTQITSPEAVPISLGELRAQCRVDPADGSEDALLAAYARAATSWAESWLGKALLTQTWEYRIEAFPYPPRPYGSITVPLGPVQSVTSIAYTDNAGLALTLDPAAYTLSGDRISPVYGTNWPAARPGVTILFTAGYGDDWNSIPEAIRQGVAMLAAYWYSQRESVTVGPDQGPASRVPYDTKEMLAPFKSWLV